MTKEKPHSPENNRKRLKKIKKEKLDLISKFSIFLNVTFFFYSANNPSIIPSKDDIGYAQDSVSYSKVSLFIRTFHGVQVIQNMLVPVFIWSIIFWA
jgi:hypothetical protein